VLRRIVMPVRGDGKGDNVFAHASALARRFHSHVVITHCRPRAEDLLPYGVPIPKAMRELLLRQTATVADQEEDSLRAEVEALAARFGVTLSDDPLDGVASASWVEQQGRQVDVIKRHGRLADLICVAKPDVSRNLGMNTLKAALFNTGRPIMMCPMADTPPATLCEHVAIAWNGSTEASRAVALTLDLVAGASSVTVLTAGSEVNGADSDSLVRYLAERGIAASIDRFASRKRVGKPLLEHSAACGADTLIMGAYSQSHERETVLGGNTQHIVDHSTMPVVFVH